MSRLDEIRRHVLDSIGIKHDILADGKLLQQLADLAGDCLRAIQNGGKIIFAGNGGSFADAQHLSAEFTSRFRFDRSALPSIALGTNCSAMSAIGNDYGFDQTFARELQGIARREDVFIPISTSGNSPNVLKAIDAAQRLGLRTVAWTGSAGGTLLSLCECLRVPSNDTARIQECHIMLGHILCELVESEAFRGKHEQA